MIFISPINQKTEEEQKKKRGHKNWAIARLNDDGTFGGIIVELNLNQSSLTNKFEIVMDLFDDLNKTVPEFSNWYEDLLIRYIESSYNSELLLKEAPKFCEMAESYVDAKNVNYSSFVDKSKTTKTSIFFDEDDIYSIAKVSTALKLYSVFWHDERLKLPENIHRKVYEQLIKPCLDSETTNKMFELIKSRTYSSTMTDRYIWDLIKMMVLETPESHIMTVFNFIMINLLPTSDITKNPIPYIKSSIDSSLSWLMCNVYKDKILYGEVFSGATDIYGSSSTKESFYLFCCNDLISKGAKLAMDILEKEYGINDSDFVTVRDRIDQVTIMQPHMKFVILPLISKVLDVPYKHLLSTSPKHIMLLGILMHHLAKDNLSERFPIITEFLLAAPTQKNFITVKSSYKLNNLNFVIHDKNRMFGFNHGSIISLKYKVISPICGLLSTTKKSLISIIDGEPINKIKYFDLEKDVSTFFLELYSGKLNKEIERMKENLDELL